MFYLCLWCTLSNVTCATHVSVCTLNNVIHITHTCIYAYLENYSKLLAVVLAAILPSSHVTHLQQTVAADTVMSTIQMHHDLKSVQQSQHSHQSNSAGTNNYTNPHCRVCQVKHYKILVVAVCHILTPIMHS